jgi:plastocyanin
MFFKRIDMRKLFLIPLLIGIQAAVAQSNPLPPTAVTVSLSNFNFTPETIYLKAGVPVVLHLENRSNGGHNFSAPQFFAAAKLDPTSGSLVQRGTVEIPGGGVRDVAVIPAAGRYPLKCTHTFHSMFGMKGIIVVD